MRVVDIIRRKREGGAHTDEELRFLVRGFARGEVSDYQMSAWLMAVVWRGLTDEETFALTGAMVGSGDVLDLSGLAGPCVDKHSTGGVGDKTTLAVVPILAAGGVQVPKMSGHGLGHTGGTLDKLESLGMHTDFSAPEIIAQVQRVGACLCGQTERLVPADRLMYALRDATDTVQSLPLIAASIMSKKIAGGCPNIILDVKVGRGAFMKSLPEARALARLMIGIGAAHGRRAAAVLSDMDAPLGRTVGNRLEVGEVVRLLRDDADAEPRLRALVRTLAGAGLMLAGRVATPAEGESLAASLTASGAALEKLRAIVAAQGGGADALDLAVGPPAAPASYDVQALGDGFVTHLDAEAVGLAAMRLGAGRAAKGDAIDPDAGVVLRRSVGDRVAVGDILATLYASTEAAAREVAPSVVDAYAFAPTPAAAAPVVLEIIGLDP